MITNGEYNTEQKVLAIQKEVEEATALELPCSRKTWSSCQPSLPWVP